MPKRPHPDDDIVQPIKKQQNTKFKSRKIRSLSSERTFQLLYEGAAKLYSHENGKQQQKIVCLSCSSIVVSTITCNFCEKDVCVECKNNCYKCNEEFCPNCSFHTYDQHEAVCYSCST